MGRVLKAVFLCAALAVLAPASASARPLNPFQVNLGVGLYGSAGSCAVQAPRVLKRCTLPPSDRPVQGVDEYPKVPGHILSFRLRLREPTEDTTAVEVRFRVRPGPLGTGGRVGPWESLDLEGPGLQEFPLAVPLGAGDRAAIDVIVHGDGAGEAASPIVSMKAVFERDDRVGPRLRVSYEPYQDFLRTGRVVVEVHSDSIGTLDPECSLLTGDAQWGLLFNSRHLRPDGWARFTCRFYGAPLRVARRKARRGGHPLVMVHPIAYDSAGNCGALPKIYVRPG